MEQCRSVIESSGLDVWTLIERAIAVAWADYPQELRSRRDGLTERLYAPHLALVKSFEDALPKGSDKSGVYTTRDEEEDEEERDDDDDDVEEHQRHRRNSISNEEAREDTFDDDEIRDEMVEALNEEMEEEQLLMREISSIKESMRDVEQPEANVMEHLHRLEDLNISVEALKMTEIGKEVNAFRKHPSLRVRALTKKIVRSWKDLVDEWVKNASDISAAATGHASSDMGDDEVGLPSPPLDEESLLASRTVSVEMSQLLNFTDDELSAASGASPPGSDGLSDFGSFPDVRRKISQPDARRAVARPSTSPSEEKEVYVSKGAASIHNTDKQRPLNIESNNVRSVTASSTNIKKGVAVVTSGVKPNTGMNTSTGSGRPVIAHPRQNNDVTWRKPDLRPAANLANKPKVEASKPALPIKPKPLNLEVSEEDKLAASKRKLNENYHKLELAKKMRTTQALDLTELPKGGPKAQRLPQQKPGQNRAWGRR